MNRNDPYRVCYLCGVKRPLDLFWHSENYEEVDVICSICAIGANRLKPKDDQLCLKNRIRNTSFRIITNPLCTPRPYRH